MEQEIYFYQAPGMYTDPKEFRPLLRSLPDDPLEIIRFIKKILIHPLDAKKCGVRFDTKRVLRNQADHRSGNDILANPKVNSLLRLGTLDFESGPDQRGILSCDHHAVLFAAILRLKGQAVRARWKYIDPEQTRLNVDA